jgi:glycosyltransferase involved in cell wall biosynthesis
MKILIAGPMCLRTLGITAEQDRPETMAPLSHYTNQLRAMGHTVEAVTLGFTSEKRRFHDDSLSVLVVPRRRSGAGRDFFRQERLELAEAIAASDAEIVHAHWTYEYALAAQASEKPCVITAHDAPFALLRYMRPLHFWLPYVLMSLPVLHRSTELCVVSPYLEKYFRTVHFYRKPINVVPVFLPPAASNLFREKGLDTAVPVFASVNRAWGPLKNVTTLLRAFALVRQSIPGARLLLFGPCYGPLEQAEQYAQAHGLTQGVEFRGSTPNAALLTHLAQEVDFLVHPSREESFCIAIADAMAIGIPVIGGRKSGAVPWLLEQGNCGILTDINDEKEVASAMVRLAQDVGLAKDLRENARRRVEKSFRLEQVARRYIELYEKKLESLGPKSNRNLESKKLN